MVYSSVYFAPVDVNVLVRVTAKPRGPTAKGVPNFFSQTPVLTAHSSTFFPVSKVHTFPDGSTATSNEMGGRRPTPCQLTQIRAGSTQRRPHRYRCRGRKRPPRKDPADCSNCPPQPLQARRTRPLAPPCHVRLWRRRLRPLHKCRYRQTDPNTHRCRIELLHAIIALVYHIHVARGGLHERFARIVHGHPNRFLELAGPRAFATERDTRNVHPRRQRRRSKTQHQRDEDDTRSPKPTYTVRPIDAQNQTYRYLSKWEHMGGAACCVSHTLVR